MPVPHQPRRDLTGRPQLRHGLLVLGILLALVLPGPDSLGATSATSATSAERTSGAVVTAGPVALRTVHTTVKGAQATTVAATYRGTDRFVKRSLETAVAALAAQQLAAFNDAYEGATPGRPAGAYELTGRVVANASPVLSLEFHEYIDLAGAHPADGFHVIVVNSRTGRIWSQHDLAVQLGDAVRPGHTLLGEVRRAVAAAVPTEVRSESARLTLDDVTLVPTSSGLRVDVDRCALGCVLGSMQSTIRWTRLLDPQAEVEFVPALWRR